MGLFGRLLGRKDVEEGAPVTLEPNEALGDVLSLQVLLPGRLAVDEHGLSRALHAYDKAMKGARVELTQDAQGEAVLGLAGWGRHVVRLVGFHLPAPEPEVEWCYGAAHLTPESEARARAHQSHVLLVYAGYEKDPLEQYVALAAVAGALVVSSDALVAINEAARAAVPARMLASAGKDALARLRELPLPMLYAGFGVVEAGREAGVWMRTYGAAKLRLPDLAFRARDEEEEKRGFELFSGALASLRSAGAAAGQRVELGGEGFVLRAPAPTERALESREPLLVVERAPERRQAIS